MQGLKKRRHYLDGAISERTHMEIAGCPIINSSAEWIKFLLIFNNLSVKSACWSNPSTSCLTEQLHFSKKKLQWLHMTQSYAGSNVMAWQQYSVYTCTLNGPTCNRWRISRTLLISIHWESVFLKFKPAFKTLHNDNTNRRYSFSFKYFLQLFIYNYVSTTQLQRFDEVERKSTTPEDCLQPKFKTLPGILNLSVFWNWKCFERTTAAAQAYWMLFCSEFINVVFPSANQGNCLF